MSSKTNTSLWARWRNLSNDSPTKIVVVAVGVCLACSILVSSAAVLLKPRQQENEAQARQQEILKVAGLYRADADMETLFEAIETRYVDLVSGDYIAANDVPTPTVLTLAREHDIAGIGKHPRHVPIYHVYENDVLATLILPLIGKGLWSTIHGFVALAADGNTVKAISFYDHAETPGLGSEISSPDWQAKWQGKKIVGMHGHMQIRVIKGQVDPASHHADYEIDGLSGATLTANGVTNMVHYWLGEHGFGPFLARVRVSGPEGG